jgi:electron transfer flavoprotein beta subunit
MKLVVCVKQVDIVGDELSFTTDETSVLPDLLDHGLNEWDASAVEQALRLREVLGAGEVVAVTCGDVESETALRRCLAMGATRAIRVEEKTWDPISTARALASSIERESPDLVLCGVQSSDSVQGSTGVALAQVLGYAWAAVVTKVTWSGAGPIAVERELESGLQEMVELDTPAVVTMQTGSNQPRYVTLRAIKQAEQQPIPVVTPSELPEPGYRIRRMFAPPKVREATFMTGTPQEVATQIASIIREQLR